MVALLAIVLQHLSSAQHVLCRQASIQEDAKVLRTELADRQPPDSYAAAWERGAGREFQSMVDEVLATAHQLPFRA